MNREKVNNAVEWLKTDLSGLRESVESIGLAWTSDYELERMEECREKGDVRWTLTQEDKEEMKEAILEVLG